MADKLIDNYILDTSVPLHRATSIFNYPMANVIIPITVIDEANKKKTVQTGVGKNARDFLRYYLALREIKRDMASEPVELDHGGTFRIEMNHKHNAAIKELFPMDENDHRIISVGVNLAIERPDKNFYFVTDDTEQLAKADLVQSFLKVQNFHPMLYEKDRLVKGIDDVHTGYTEVLVKSDFFATFKESRKMNFREFEKYIVRSVDEKEVLLNDFIICKNEHSENQRITVKYILEDGVKVVRPLLTVDPMNTKGIKAINPKQTMLMDHLYDDNIKVVAIHGKPGTGKTLLALASGLAQIEKYRSFTKLLAARPVIPMGKDLGYLPGDKDEKLSLWMQPIFDNLEYIYNQELHRVESKGMALETEKMKSAEQILLENQFIQLEALTYIRGRSIPNQFIIIDEAQNLSIHEIKTIITRAGKGTKIILAGDTEQIDHPYLDAINNGLTYGTEKLKGQSFFATITLDKSERSEVAEIAASLL